MSITDPPKQENLQDIYPPGTAFQLVEAWIEGQVDTQYGKRTMGKILVTPAEGGDKREFAVWGSLAEQVQQLEDGELPMTVTVKQDGRRWLFAAVEPFAAPADHGGALDTPADDPSKRAVPDAHVDAAAAADPPAPVPEATRPGPEPAPDAQADAPQPVPPAAPPGPEPDPDAETV